MIVTASRAYRPRQKETFPILTAEKTERLRRYGKLTRYSDGERPVETARSVLIVVLLGLVAITERDRLGHATPIAS